MFQLRKEHIDALDETARLDFEDRMVRDIAERFYDQYETLGEAQVRERIADGVERAPRYEIREPINIAKFIRLMFGIGPSFDTDHKTRFARDILEQIDRPAADRLNEIKKKARGQGIRQPK